MKFIILSDIHGNARALKECMNVIENMEFDAIIWCGDYITDFPESHKVIELIKSLPEELEIILDDKNKIYISHKCTYKNIDKCKYKIFGHTHKQYNFIRESIKYINPGSVGITTDEVVGAQFSILEITDRFDKIDEVIVKYDITNILETIKDTPIYNDDIKWGKLLEWELKTGMDYPQMCIREYNRIREEHRINEESLEVWNVAINNVLNL